MGGVGAKSVPSPRIPSFIIIIICGKRTQPRKPIFGFKASAQIAPTGGSLIASTMASRLCTSGAYDAIVTAVTTSTVRRHHLELLLSIETTTAIRTW